MYMHLRTALAVIASTVAARAAVAIVEPHHQGGSGVEPRAIRVLAALLIAVSCLASSPPSSANQAFQLYNCDRNFNLCQSKCNPEVKRTKDGFTLDGSKVPDCRRKCIDTQRKCQADAAKAPRTCTTTAQCAHPDEICSHGKCLKY